MVWIDNRLDADCADSAGGTIVYKYMRIYLWSAPTVEVFETRIYTDLHPRRFALGPKRASQKTTTPAVLRSKTRRRGFRCATRRGGYAGVCASLRHCATRVSAALRCFCLLGFALLLTKIVRIILTKAGVAQNKTGEGSPSNTVMVIL